MRLLSTGTIARACARRPWLVVAVWLALLAAGVALTSQIGSVLTSEFSFSTKPDSIRADELLEERLRGPEQGREIIIVRSEDRAVDDPQFRAAAERIVGELRALDGAVDNVVSYYDAPVPDLVSADQRTLLIPVTVIGDVGEGADNVGPIVDVVEDANGRDGFEVLTAGSGSIERTFNDASAHDAETGERIGVPVALIILLLVFGAAVAAGIPLIMAIVSIVVAFGVATIIGQTYDLSFLVLNIVPMIGLAVGIDYTLIIVQRFREERAHGLEKLDAIAMSGATAGRTVLFSGGTVVVGLLGMTVVPSTVYRSIAIGTIVVGVVAVICALTLLPAVLSLLGDKVNRLKVPFIGRSGGIAPAAEGDETGGFWGHVASIVMGHPWISVAASVGILLALALPALSLKLGLSGVTTLPDGYDSRRAFEILDEQFSGGRISPAEIVITADDVDAPAVQERVDRLEAALAADPQAMFGQPQRETNDARDLLLLSVPVNGDPHSDAAHAAIRRLRSDIIPAAFDGVDAQVLVTGETAGNEDFYDVIRTYAPYVFGFVLGLSFLLLMLVFRSIVVPVKALIMNLLSVAAAYGLLVLVFQEGVGSDLLGFQQTETIEAWLPLFLFSVLFGLSMDYHVFLLSRIRERFDQTHDNAASVAFGLRSTAGMITGAAMIMVAVFTGFALGDIVSLQQVGFGLAVAVILDATIIRVVLVPASMELLGNWNWYLPRWLQWLPHLQIEGPASPARGSELERTAAAGS
jgi:RND superfamily putative drug exporter